MRRLLLLAALLLVALEARAETCTFSTSGNWTSAILYGGTDDCALDASDSILIGNGVTPVTATITTGSTVSMTTGSITVQSGSTLTIQSGGNLAVPDAGLVVSPGGTFTPRGNAVSYGDATPTLVTALSDGGGADVNTSVPVGKIIHCPGVSAGANATSATAIVTDCTAPPEAGEAGTLDEIALCWPDANVNAELLGGFDVGTGLAGEQFFSQWLAQIAAGDVVVFWDSTNQRPSRDVNAHYEVTFVNTQAANRCIGLSVRQGSTEGSCGASAFGCHLIDRDVQPCTVTTTAYAAGARTLQCDANAVTSLNQRAGRNLTCPADRDASGAVDPGERQASTIVSATVADALRLMPGGLPYNVPLGSVCWIDYGWKAGDEISAYKPARLTQIQNPTCAGVGAPVACCGNPTGGADPNFGQCGPITCGRGATCDVDFTLATRLGRTTMFPTSTIDNSWWREVGSAMQLVAIEGAGPFSRFQLSSPAWSGGDDAHGINVAGGGTSVFNDVTLRHWGDDAFCPNACNVTSATACDGGAQDTDAAKVYGIKATRLRAEYAGCVGTSCAMFDECGLGNGDGGAVVYDVRDLLAIDATERTLTNGQLNLTLDTVAGSQRLRNVAMVANYSPLHESSPAAGATSRVELSNYYDIGRQLVASNTYHLITAHTITDASLVDVSNTGSMPLLGNTQLDAPAGVVEWKRVLVLDPDAPAAPTNGMFLNDDAPAALSMTDFAIISPNRTGQGDGSTLWRLRSSSGASTVPMRFNRITIGMRPGETNEFTTGFYALTDGGSAPYDGGFRTMQNALGAFFWRTAAGVLAAWTIDAGLEEFIASPWCDVGSSQPFSAALQAAMTSGVRDVRQAFVNPAVGNLEPVRGSLIHASGCGARKVGAREMWALRVLGHGIYNGYGDTWKVKGGGSSRRGPRATP